MLSIGKLTAAQSTYYEGQVARGLGDYYSGRGEEPGRWVGTMAGSLGLAGEVEESDFAALMAGAEPRPVRRWCAAGLDRPSRPTT